MGEMQEWWQNVYDLKGGRRLKGERHETRSGAAAHHGGLHRLAYRIHVRLKPEGAPKRYASEGERLVWQDDPDWARGVIRTRSHEVSERMIESRAGQLLCATKIEKRT